MSYNLPQVRVRVVNDLLNLSDMRDLEGTETPGSGILNNLHKISYLYRLPQCKSSVFNCTAHTQTKLTLHTAE